MAVVATVRIRRLEGATRLDSEYYQPKFFRNAAAIRGAGFPVATVEDVITDIKGSAFYPALVEDYAEEGVPFLRVSDLGHFCINDSDIVRVAERVLRQYGQIAFVQERDIVLAKGGSIGGVCLVQPGMGECAICRDVIAISPDHNKVEPYYLLAFLLSRPGQLQLDRNKSQQVQAHLTFPAVTGLLMPLPPPRQQKAIAAFIEQALSQRNRAAETIAAAETRLMEALGLDRLDLSPQKCYTRRFRDLEAASRFGAEYFMPCKTRILAALTKMPHRTVEAHAPGIRDMYDPTRARKGEMVRNFDITDALEPFLDDSREPEPAIEMGSSKKRFQAGDVVVSRLRSYLKEIAVVRTSGTPQSVGSSEYIVLRPTGKGLSPETLIVYLRCPLVQTILKWSQDGSNHPRFTEEDLLAIPVPDKLLSVQKQIDGLVNKAIDARIEAARLLEQAKKTVEDLIAGPR